MLSYPSFNMSDFLSMWLFFFRSSLPKCPEGLGAVLGTILRGLFLRGVSRVTDHAFDDLYRESYYKFP